MQLLREVEKFLRQNDTAPTRFGREVVGDPRFVFARPLRKSGSIALTIEALTITAD